MKQVMILVEGQTEETFINKVLQPYFFEKEIFLSATIICTKQVKSVRRHRGGGNNYDFIKRDLSKLLRSHFDLVTTLIDYYALPENFPGQGTLPTTIDCYAKINHLEREFLQDINNPKFLPFIMVHELETMLFCDIYSLSDFFSHKMANLHRLNSVLTEVKNPELINNSPETAPSKRILAELEGYKKTLHGPIAITNIGIDKIRQLCPHFNEWLSKIESL